MKKVHQEVWTKSIGSNALDVNVGRMISQKPLDQVWFTTVGNVRDVVWYQVRNNLSDVVWHQVRNHLNEISEEV